jgi:solute carrier family 13 (sodium-dependent dicarboxylate transporter), member 2/3/5
MFPSTIACSFAFLTPIGTPPNAIVYAYGKIKIWNMCIDGFFLSVFSVGLLTLWSYLLLGPFFNVQANVLPIWANSTITNSTNFLFFNN